MTGIMTRIYTHIVFDIDGTLLNTEEAILRSLEDLISEELHRDIPEKNLLFALGIPGEVALQSLGFANPSYSLKRWNILMQKYSHYIHLFDGIPELLESLRNKDYSLGIVTSKDRNEYIADFVPFGIDGYFDVVICVDDAAAPKPSPAPLLAYLAHAKVKAENAFYIGDTVYDKICAEQASVDFGYASWRNPQRVEIPASYTFSKPSDILKTLTLNKR